MPTPPRSAAVERLLDELGADVRRGAPPGAAEAPRLASGVVALDRLLGGGIPRGRVTELSGPPTSGRTSLARALLAGATAAGHWTAWIDAADALDPASAEEAGVDLERILWVRPPSPALALRCAEHVLAARGFALVGLDLALATGAVEPPAAAVWTRLRRLAAGTETALLVLSHRRLAGSFADLAVEAEAARPLFAPAPDWLEGLESDLRVVRSRVGPARVRTGVRWNVDAA